MTIPTLSDAEALDVADPLGPLRDRVRLPAGLIYLDGNSLGALPDGTPEIITDAVEQQWGNRLIRSWNEADWIGAPRRIGDKIARIVGAHPGEVIATDSTSVNLFKLIVAAAERVPDRSTILVEAGNFPTDLHVARRAAQLLGRRLEVVAHCALAASFDSNTAVAVLSHVHYRTGERYDMAALNSAAREAGARIVWDLSHSVGAIPLSLRDDGAELAVGCGYKYLNGGPGAPAFLYARNDLIGQLASPIAGWFGHARPFTFEDGYEPAPGIERFLAGTPPMLSLLALEGGVDLMLAADRALLWQKSCGLFELFADLMAVRCPTFRLISPRHPARRGSHIAFAHADAFPIVQALIAADVVGDFRTPDVLRFGLTPITLRYADVWRAVDILAGVMAQDCWRQAHFQAHGAVT